MRKKMFVVIAVLLAYPLISSAQDFEEGSFLTTLEQQALNDSVKKFPSQGTTSIEVISDTLIHITKVPVWDPEFPEDRNDSSKDFGFDHLIGIGDAEAVDNYSVTSADDPNFISGVQPLAASFKRRTAFAPLQETDLRCLEEIFIKLPFSMQPGSAYALAVENVFGSQSQAFSFEYQQPVFSKAIHTSPVFSANGEKKAYLGMFLGSRGELTIDATDLQLIHLTPGSPEQRTVVFQSDGTLDISWTWNVDWNEYDNVHVFDFTEVTQEGWYIVQHSKLGSSQPFQIKQDAMRVPLTTVAKGMLHYRSDYSLDESVTYFAHGAGHTDDAHVYQTATLPAHIMSGLNDGDRLERLNQTPENATLLFPTSREGMYQDTRGGHYDAGDYGKYTHNGAKVVWLLTTWLETFGEKVQHDNLGMPFSGNGIPDLLDELLWEIRWLKNMQDPDDGGVFSMVKPCNGSFQMNEMPDAQNFPRCLMPKDTVHTGAYAAALARAARSTVISNHDPELALELRARAISAWNFLEANKPTSLSPHIFGEHKARDGDVFDGAPGYYGYKYGSIDERAWAAIELFALTGELEYQTAFVEYHQPNEALYTWMQLPEGFGYANRTLALWESTNPALSPEMAVLKNDAEITYKKAIYDIVRNANETPYGLSLSAPYKNWRNPRWFFPSDYSYDLLIAREKYNELFSGETPGIIYDYSIDIYKYNADRDVVQDTRDMFYGVFEADVLKQVATDQIYYILGNNPTNQSFITGFGHTRMLSLVDHESYNDQIAMPVTGIMTAPLASGFYYLDVYGLALGKTVYPPDVNQDEYEGTNLFPLMDQVYDGWNVYAEATIDNMAALYSVLAVLEDTTTTTTDYPIASFTMIRNGDELTTQVNVTGGTAPYAVMWFINDEPASVDPSFTFTQNFSDPSNYIQLEVTDSNGLQSYVSRQLLNTTDYSSNAIPHAALEITEDTLALYHFDNNEVDSVGTLDDAVLTGNATFDESNLFWMEQQSGTALWLDGIDDTTQIVIPSEHMNTALDIERISVEGMFYFDGHIPGYGEAHAELFRFEKNWDITMKLWQGNWDANPTLTLGTTEVMHNDKSLGELLSPYQWHHIKMEVDNDGYDFSINGFKVVENLTAPCQTDENLECWKGSTRDIVLTAGDMNGWLDEIKVDVQYEQIQTNDKKNPLVVSQNTAVLYNFDNGIADSAGNAADLTLYGSSTLDDSNLEWMNAPSGSALKFTGTGDYAKTSIPHGAVYDGRPLKQMVIEGLYYFDGNLTGWGVDHSNYVYLKKNWDIHTRIDKDKWHNNPSLLFGNGRPMSNDPVLTEKFSPYTWHHFKVVIDENGYNYYINDEPIVENYAYQCASNGGKMNVHCWEGTQNLEFRFGDFNGWIDEVAITVYAEGDVIPPTDPPSTPPVAVVGESQTVHMGTRVILDGSASFDSNNLYPLTYNWTLVSKPQQSTAVIENPQAATPSILIDQPGDYAVELFVVNSQNVESVVSAFTISTTNSTPVADAGEDQTVTSLNTPIELDGSQSWDPDGDSISYYWSILNQPEGSTTIIDDEFSSVASLSPDSYGLYLVELIVTDMWGESTTHQVTISSENLQPLAHAGNSQSGFVGDIFVLDGTQSSDPNNDALQYVWTLVSQPEGSLIQLDYENQEIAYTSMDTAGVYVISLTVNDGLLSSEPVNITIALSSHQDAAIDAIQEAVFLVSDLSKQDVKNKNMPKTLINKCNSVLLSIENADYAEAANKLKNDILKKTDGCNNTGSPDKNDWILNCPSQNPIAAEIEVAIQYLNLLI